ncbi:MAG: amidophosphoribosyltransferase [Acidobacteria bacterium]|nr:amidophosphoribosyltransferase [Acidobacteriota bacterium]MBI3658766.1 amidophosphoribosyltransferase [Acidobacteriota bacterium]
MLPDKLKEECGVFGVFGHPEAARLVYLGLYALQHRGQEAAGICSSDGQTLYVERGTGYVADVFGEPRLDRLRGEAAIGHVRYSTAGDSSLNNAQPILISGGQGRLALCHNGNLTGVTELRSSLAAAGAVFHSTSDSELILHLISRSKETELERAVVDALQGVSGAYSLLIQKADCMIAVRDPLGFRPLCLGRLNHKSQAWVVASETCALDLINAEYIRDIEPGEMILLDRHGLRSIQFAPGDAPAFCSFEHIYFSRPDSRVFGRSVMLSRQALGRVLAKEAPADADVVVPIPDSGVPAGAGYAAASGLPIEFGLIRNHYVGRTFIEPKQSIRNFGVKVKLNPVRELLQNRRVVLVDDSIVRGTTSRKIVQMVRAAGAREVHMRISSPPIISPCYYGIDTPTRAELIAANHSVDEVRRYIDADSLAYLSHEGLMCALEDNNRKYCTSCFSGKYPSKIN